MSNSCLSRFTIGTITLWILRLACPASVADPADAVRFGNDTVKMQASAHITPVGMRTRLARAVESTAMRPTKPENLVCREGVELFREVRMGLLAKLADGYTRVDWRNILLCVEPLEDQDQVLAVTNLLHAASGAQSMPVSVARRLVKEIQAGNAPKSLTLGVPSLPDVTSPTCFARDSTWFVRLFYLEQANVVEYKYVFTRTAEVGRIRRVVVGGPAPVGHPPGGVILTPSVEDQARSVAYDECRRYLLQAICGEASTPGRDL